MESCKWVLPVLDAWCVRRAKAAQLLAKYGVDASNPLVTHAPRGSDDDDSEGDEDDEGDEGDEGEDEEDSSSDEEGEQGDEEVGATASGEEEEEEEGGDGARLGSEDGASGSDEGEGASSDEGEEEEGGSGDDVGEGESGSGEGEEEEEGRSDEEEGDGLAAMQRRLQQRQQAAGVGAEVARPSPYVLRLPPLEPKKPSAASANGAAATAAQQQQQQQEGEGGELQDDGDDAPLDLPYTIRMPETYQGFAELVRGRPARHLLLAIERIRAFNAAALAADAKRQLQVGWAAVGPGGGWATAERSLCARCRKVLVLACLFVPLRARRCFSACWCSTLPCWRAARALAGGCPCSTWTRSPPCCCT